MPIGTYGPIIFGTGPTGVLTFDNFKKTVTARWGTHEVYQDKPLLEYAGPNLIEVAFTMGLISPITSDPTAAIVTLQETMDLALPYPLTIGMLPVGRDASLFILESLEVNPKYFYRGGTIIGAEVAVKLKEYPTNFISTLLQALGGLFGGGGAASTVAPDIQAPSNPVQLAPEVRVGQPVQVYPTIAEDQP